MNEHVERAQRMCAKHGALLVYLVRSGAHAYGTATADSDDDIRGVFIPAWTDMIGLSVREEIRDNPSDTVLFSIQKFAKLCLAGNPNILDWLFVPRSEVLLEHETFPLRTTRYQWFLSMNVYRRFRGYAFSHFQKMQRGVTRKLGAKRKADIEEHGYSTKNAMHLIRLARMGLECVRFGEYNVFRKDAAELLNIRAGKWSPEEVIAHGESLICRMDEAVPTSPLPHKPKTKIVEQMVVNCVLANRRW